MLSFFQTRAYLSEELIRMEPEDGIEKVVDTLKTCRLYKETYYTSKESLKTYFKDEPVVEWQFESNLIFSRIEKLIKKLETIDVRNHDLNNQKEFDIHL